MSRTDHRVPEGMNRFSCARSCASTARGFRRALAVLLGISVAAVAQTYNWLAVPPGANFKLVLTLLDTPVAGSTGLIDIKMPDIQKTGCGHA